MRTSDPKIVEKFAQVSDSMRSYYIKEWAKREGINSDEAMELAGYQRDYYIGAGAYMWRYVGNGS